ncbi:MAG: DUF4058 family protein [Planctomycetes bacterium]|nr:DUF4058 family protein [Planctomycetota bacterium]
MPPAGARDGGREQYEYTGDSLGMSTRLWPPVWLEYGKGGCGDAFAAARNGPVYRAPGLRDKLPVIPVPLLYPDPDAPLDLGGVVAAVYERGAYARLIDYRQPPPPPPLSDADAAWLDERLVAQKAR